MTATIFIIVINLKEWPKLIIRYNHKVAVTKFKCKYEESFYSRTHESFALIFFEEHHYSGNLFLSLLRHLLFTTFCNSDNYYEGRSPYVDNASTISTNVCGFYPYQGFPLHQNDLRNFLTFIHLSRMFSFFLMNSKIQP